MNFEIENLRDADVAKNRKENHFYKEDAVLIVKDGIIKTVFTVRYYATQSTHYCCVWLSLPDKWIHTSGKAGGYGYHRESAALNDALRNAGIIFRGLSGTGQNEEALKLLFAFFYPELEFNLHTAHA